MYFWTSCVPPSTRLYSFCSIPLGIQKHVWTNYLTQRDFRASRLTEDSQLFKGCSSRCVPLFWKAPRLSDVVRLGSISRMVWDWHCHGGRLRRFASTPPASAIAAKCPLCGDEDSQRHWMFVCPDPASQRLREEFNKRLCDDLRVNSFLPHPLLPHTSQTPSA